MSATAPAAPPGFRRIFFFWLPLASTWLMMAVEGPFLAAVIARLPDPVYNLAAYGVAFSFALIAEAPVIMLMGATTAIVSDALSFKQMRRFAFAVSVLTSLVLLIFLIPAVFYAVAIGLIGLEQRVADLTYYACMILLPWPAAIGYRRFYQGVLIQDHQTRRVAYGTFLRIFSMSATALLCFWLDLLPGALVGAAALSAAVLVEGAASRWMARHSIRRVLAKATKEGERELSFRYLLGFYYPLALNSLIGLGVHPLVTFFIGRSKEALASLAILPVVNSLTFLFRSFGLSFHEVALTFLGEDNRHHRRMLQFALVLGSMASGMLALIVFTPLADIWFLQISGLQPDLADFAALPAQILAIFPFLTMMISYQRALLVNAHHTRPITYGTVIEVAGIMVALYFFVAQQDLIGAVAAALAYTFGRLLANAYLLHADLGVLPVRHSTVQEAA